MLFNFLLFFYIRVIVYTTIFLSIFLFFLCRKNNMHITHTHSLITSLTYSLISFSSHTIYWLSYTHTHMIIIYHNTYTTYIYIYIYIYTHPPARTRTERMPTCAAGDEVRPAQWRARTVARTAGSRGHTVTRTRTWWWGRGGRPGWRGRHGGEGVAVGVTRRGWHGGWQGEAAAGWWGEGAGDSGVAGRRGEDGEAGVGWRGTQADGVKARRSGEDKGRQAAMLDPVWRQGDGRGGGHGGRQPSWIRWSWGRDDDERHGDGGEDRKWSAAAAVLWPGSSGEDGEEKRREKAAVYKGDL
jgi:hypothetical protein